MSIILIPIIIGIIYKHNFLKIFYPWDFNTNLLFKLIIYKNIKKKLFVSYEAIYSLIKIFNKFWIILKKIIYFIFF